MDDIQTKQLKGQVFLKFLWQSSLYQIDEGKISPQLSDDLLQAAKRLGEDKPTSAINTVKIFHWINGAVIPQWVRLCAFHLALIKGWKPVDKADVLSVLMLNQSINSETDVMALAKKTEKSYCLKLPRDPLKHAMRVIQDGSFD